MSFGGIMKKEIRLKNMIKHRVGDLLKQTDINAILHCCNCFHTFGSGIAKTIREKFPEAYNVDLTTTKGDVNKLGTFSFTTLKNGIGCYNLYGQFNYGRDKQYLNYDAFKNGLVLVKSDFLDRYGKSGKLGMPYKIGSVNAGGDWNEVLKIIREVFENETLEIVICEFKEYSPQEEDFKNKLRAAYKKSELLGLTESHTNES